MKQGYSILNYFDDLAGIETGSRAIDALYFLGSTIAELDSSGTTSIMFLGVFFDSKTMLFCITLERVLFFENNTHTHTQLFLNTCFYIITGKYEINDSSMRCVSCHEIQIKFTLARS